MTVSILTWYKQEENRFTNALFSILDLSRMEQPEFLPGFMDEVLGLKVAENTDVVSVLKEIGGTADAELRGEDFCFRFETKIQSGTLREDQVCCHLSSLNERSESLKRLILLTPDDGGSNYIQRFRAIAPKQISHVAWKDVYRYLETRLLDGSSPLFQRLVRDLLDLIRDRVFLQDYIGIIAKIDFGKHSEVYEDSYLQQFANDEWKHWATPREYKGLDGTGRKLLLYDRTRQGITLEVEINEVVRTDTDEAYPWENVFAPGTIRIFDQPISVEHIRSIDGFATFGVHRRDRSPFRKLTHEQYRRLMQPIRDLT